MHLLAASCFAILDSLKSLSDSRTFAPVAVPGSTTSTRKHLELVQPCQQPVWSRIKSLPFMFVCVLYVFWKQYYNAKSPFSLCFFKAWTQKYSTCFQLKCWCHFRRLLSRTLYCACFWLNAFPHVHYRCIGTSAWWVSTRSWFCSWWLWHSKFTHRPSLLSSNMDFIFIRSTSRIMWQNGNTWSWHWNFWFINDVHGVVFSSHVIFWFDQCVARLLVTALQQPSVAPERQLATALLHADHPHKVRQAFFHSASQATLELSRRFTDVCQRFKSTAVSIHRYPMKFITMDS